MVTKQVEVSINRLIIGFGLIFLLGILFAMVNGYYTEESGDPLPYIVYVISVVSLIIGAGIILLFQTKISKVQLNSILKLLEKDESEVVRILIENNYRLEQNHLVAYTGYNKVRISRVLKKLEQRGVVEKRNIGNTNLVILNLK